MHDGIEIIIDDDHKGGRFPCSFVSPRFCDSPWSAAMRQGTAEEGNWFKGEDGVPPFCGGKEKTRILLVHFELPFFSNPFFFTASAFSSILLLIVLREETID